MPLTDVAVRNAKPRDKQYKLADSGGLYLLVTPAGGKLWRLKYRIEGTEKKLTFGAYPVVSLADARQKRDEAKRLLTYDQDPAVEKVRRKLRSREDAACTFAAVAAEFVSKRSTEGWADATKAKTDWILSLLLPDLGVVPVSKIEPIDVLTVLKRIEKRGRHETARRALQLAGQIFRYAVATARIPSDPCRDLKGALIAPKVKHFGAVLNEADAGALLRAIDGNVGQASTVYALKIAPHVFVRPGELRQAEWSEIDFENAVWIIPEGRMKMRKSHRVPLSNQVVALFRALRELIARKDGYVFPSVRTSARPISDNTLNAALRRLGYSSDEMTAHGFRSMASTLLNESGKWQPDAIERSLAHGDRDKIRGTYNRGDYWAERVEMHQWWSDYLDELRLR